MPSSAPRIDRLGTPARLSASTGGRIAALALSISLLAISRTFLDAEGSMVPLVLDVAITLVTAVSLVRPYAGGIGVGVVLTVWCFLPQFTPSLTVMELFIPVFMACIQGMFRLRNVLTAWYLVAALVPTALYWSDSLAERVQTASIFVVLMAITWMLGHSLGRLSREVQTLDQARVAAVASERRAIAQDLHDAVSSATTRIIMRAEQARLRGIDDPALADDVAYILTTGRQSTSDLRSLLTTLRADADADGVRTPRWHVESLTEALEAAVAELRRSGFAVESTIRFDEESLTPTRRDALGKVVREATANIIKHAVPDSACTILVVQDDGGVEIVVANRRHGTVPAGPGTGLGLLGARERLEALGGEFETTSGPREWVLRARVPREGSRA